MKIGEAVVIALTVLMGLIVFTMTYKRVTATDRVINVRSNRDYEAKPWN